jgi:hypothetical protein
VAVLRTARRTLPLPLWLLAAVVALAALFVHPAPGAAAAAAGTRVSASTLSAAIPTGALTAEVADRQRENTPRYDGLASAFLAATAEGTTIFRGLDAGHHAFDNAPSGIARPGDPLGHADPHLHNLGFNYNSRLTSWTTDLAEASSRAGPDGVVLRTTVEEMQARVASVLQSPDAKREILLEGIIRDLEVTG